MSEKAFTVVEDLAGLLARGRLRIRLKHADTVGGIISAWFETSAGDVMQIVEDLELEAGHVFDFGPVLLPVQVGESDVERMIHRAPEQ